MVLLGHAQGAPREMTFIAPANHTMPFASFDNGEISAGFVKDISEVLARRMGYAARFRTVPGKRVGLALSRGEADGVCFVMPGWIEGEFNWTRPAIPGAVVIVANAKAPVIKSLDTLVKERIGTVLGYQYPGMEGLFGHTLERDDAPSVHHSIAKLAAGRCRYAIIDQMTIEYYLKANPTSPLRVEFTFQKYMASCAFSRTSTVKFEEVERVLAGMVDDGTIEGILALYR